MQFYRPTLHQISIVDTLQAKEQAFNSIRDALKHMDSILGQQAAQDLWKQLATADQQQIQRVDRHSLVRSASFYPIPDHTPMQVAFFAYQEGTTLLIHFIWLWDGEGDAVTFQKLRELQWPDVQPGTLNNPGQGLLLTTALMDQSNQSPWRKALATTLKAAQRWGSPGASNHLSAVESILAQLQATTGKLMPFPLKGATLYLAEQWPFPQELSTALLIFDNLQVEASQQAARFVTVGWPLVVLYHLRLERYWKEYHQKIEPELERMGLKLGEVLEHTFASQRERLDGNPPVLATANPRQVEHVLSSLSTPQYQLLEIFATMERYAHNTRRDLQNLENILHNPKALPLITPMTTSGSIEEPLTELAQRGRQIVAQIEADTSATRSLAERSTRAIEVLNTQASVLQANYERLLTLIIGIVGVALAAGQLLDTDTTKMVYRYLGGGYLWEQMIGGPPLGKGDDTVILFFVKAVSILVIGIATWLILRLVLWVRTHRK